MRVALFGATGRAGGAILRQACAAGYEVSALARSPGKLSRDDPLVTVTAGDVRDLAATGRAVQGADAVVSAIGGTCQGNTAVLQQGTAAILTAMSRHGVRRLIVIQGFHLPFPGDPRNLGRPVMTAMLRLWNRPLIADSYQMAEVLRESELDWTLIRMPLLTAGPPAGGYRVGQLALGPWSRVTTGQVADFTLACLVTGGFARQAPMIADTGRWSRQPSAGATGRRHAPGGESSALTDDLAGQARRGRS
jgi:putative NADH-flavin reductase